MQDHHQICINCQECCKCVTFTIGITPYSGGNQYRKNLTEFYQARGFKVINSKKNIEVIIPSVCPNLTPIGCKIYNNRPFACRIYDGRFDPLMKNKCKLPKE